MAEITFTTANGDAVDQRWGSDYSSQVFHVKIHPNNVGKTGRPWIMFIHGGSGILNDGRLPFIHDQPGNHLFTQVLAKTAAGDTHFNLVSYTIPQISYRFVDITWPIENVDTLGNMHSRTASAGTPEFRWLYPRPQERITAPSLWEWAKLAVCHWKSVCERFGCAPAEGYLHGASFGGTRSMLSQITPPMETAKMGSRMRTYWGLASNVTSKVNAVVAHYPQTDYRRDAPQHIAAGFTGGNVYNVSPRYIASLCGVSTLAGLNAVSSHLLNEMSFQWYIEQGLTQHLVPHYIWFERNGASGGGTNGTVTYPLPDRSAHDEQMLFDLVKAMRHAGLQGHLRYALIKPSDALFATSTAFPGDPAERTYAQVLGDDVYTWLTSIRSGQGALAGRGPMVMQHSSVATALPGGYTYTGGATVPHNI